MIKVKLFEVSQRTKERNFIKDMELQTLPKINEIVQVDEEKYTVRQIEHDIDCVNLIGQLLNKNRRAGFWE